MIRSFLKNKIVAVFLFQVFVAYGQEVKKTLSFKSGKTADILKEAETVFGVYYSYADSLLSDKYLELKENKITLTEFHLILLNNNNLSVIHVDDNMYALIAKEEDKALVLSEIVINGYLLNTIIKDWKKTTLCSFNSEVLPGVSDFDVLRAFQYLPGVKSPNQTSSGLYVKGGGPDQNLLLWNKIKIYHPGHLFGMISPVNPQIVDEAVMYSAVIPAELGSRTSSVVELKSNSVSGADKSFNLGIDMLHADLSQKTLFNKDKIGIIYSFRKSLAPFFTTPTYESYTEKVFQNSGFSLNDKRNNFDFWDGAVVIDYSITDKTKLSFSSIYIGNNLDFEGLSSQSEKQGQKMEIENFGSSIQICSELTGKLHFCSAIQLSGYDFYYNRRVDKESRTDTFLKENEVLDITADLSFRYKASDFMSFHAGYQLSGYSIAHMIRNDNENFGFTLSEKNEDIISNSTTVTADIKKNDFEIQAGSRFTSNALTPLLFEPRFNFTYILNEHLQTFIVYERRSQLLQQINENAAGDISLENYIWVLSDDRLIPVILSDHFHLGALYKRNKFVLDIDIYFKKTDGITSFSNGVVFSSADLSGGLASLSNGYNISKGIDLSLQKQISKFKFWTSYSFLDSKNKIKEVNNNNYFNSNGNIAHSVNVTASYQFSSSFITLGWFWNSGKPYSVLAENNSLVSINDRRLADFHSLDFSLLHTIVNNDNYNLKAGISLNNLYNNKVVINKEISRLYETSIDLSNPRYKISDYYSLGFTPNVFFKLSI